MWTYVVTKVDDAVLRLHTLSTCFPRHPIADSSSRRDNYEMRDTSIVFGEAAVASHGRYAHIEIYMIDRGLYTSQDLASL